MRRFFKKLNPIILILFILIAGILLKNYIGIEWKIKAFTVSYILNKFIFFIIPILIFPFITCSIVRMKTKGLYLTCFIVLLILLSNFISLMIPYIAGIHLIPYLNTKHLINISTEAKIESLITFNINPLISIEKIIVLALITGFIIIYTRSNYLLKLIENYNKISQFFFKKVFIIILPIYILGTILKVTHEINFIQFLPIFGGMITLIILLQVIYIAFLFFIGSNLDIHKTILAIKNALPAGIVGFSTMSSIITIPVTLQAAEKNIENHTVAKIAITTTVNCHDVGESISLPIIALTMLYSVTATFPDLTTYVSFAFFVALAQFGSISVPGASIIILLPFLIQYFDFSEEIISLIIGLSILTDPLGTAANVMGNSAFAIIINRFSKFR